MKTLTRSLIIFAIASLLLPFAAPPTSAKDDTNNDKTASAVATNYTPASTTVAVLPVVNQSGGKDDMKAKQTQKAQDELTLRFTERGFKIADPTAVQKAITDQKVDLSDEEFQKRQTLYDIGKAVNANLVVFLIITDTSQGWHGGTFAITRKREGKAKLKMWLVDADQQKPILSAATTEAKSSANDTAIFLGGGIMNGFGGSEYTVRAIGNGVKDLLKDFFQPYPVVTSQAIAK